MFMTPKRRLAPQSASQSTSRPASPARRRFLKTLAATTVVGVAAPVYGHECEAEHLEVVHQEVRLAGWPVAAAGMKIGQLSDLHCQDRRSVARVERAVSLLLAQKPDVVFLTGDFVSSASTYIRASVRALTLLRTVPRGVFAVLGNHDWGGRHHEERPAHVTRALEQAGFQVLRNRSAPLPGTPDVWLVGLDPRSMSAQDPVQALRGVPAGAVKLLLVHEPDYADEAPPGFSLQLSGHSHGGQIRLPGLPPLHCPNYGRQYPEGLQQAAHHLVYTSRGVGMIGPQVRLFCPPEVTVLTVQPAG